MLVPPHFGFHRLITASFVTGHQAGEFLLNLDLRWAADQPPLYKQILLLMLRSCSDDTYSNDWPCVHHITVTYTGQEGHDALGMWQKWGTQGMHTELWGEISWKMSTWKTEKMTKVMLR